MNNRSAIALRKLRKVGQINFTVYSNVRRMAGV